MNGSDWLRSLEGGASSHRTVEWLDVLVYAEEQHPGRGEAARWLAGEMGVSVRQAQRYLAIATPGTEQSHQPARGAQVAAARRLQAEIQEQWDEADQADARDQTADLLRLITHLDPGKVIVISISTPNKGTTPRKIGNVRVNLSAVADAWQAGDEDRADEELSSAILSAYGSGLDEVLAIVDYPDGIDWT